MVANELINDLALAETWGVPPWEVSNKDPEVWRDPYRLFNSIYAEVKDSLNPTH